MNSKHASQLHPYAYAKTCLFALTNPTTKLELHFPLYKLLGVEDSRNMRRKYMEKYVQGSMYRGRTQNFFKSQSLNFSKSQSESPYIRRELEIFPSPTVGLRKIPGPLAICRGKGV